MRGALSKEIENGSKTGLDSGLSWFSCLGRKMKCVAERISVGGPPWANEAGGRALHPRGKVVGPLVCILFHKSSNIL